MAKKQVAEKELEAKTAELQGADARLAEIEMLIIYEECGAKKNLCANRLFRQAQNLITCPIFFCLKP